MKRSIVLMGCLMAIGAAAPLRAAGAGFSFNDATGDHLDVLLDGKIVARYMYAHDTSTPERRAVTYKPFLHVFDAEGKAPITNGGPAGLYPHHRGIFIGFRKMHFNGKDYDRWHMTGGEIVHQKFLEQKADSTAATFTSLTHWNDENGKPFIVEERTTTIRPTPAGRVTIDFTSKLTAPAGDVTLDGDPEHAGIHYRPLDGAKAIQYVFPKEAADPKKDVDYAWVGETYSIGDRNYSVVEMSHPENPKGTKWSAYRDYGRFGAFPKTEVKSGQSLTLKYRFLIADGEMVQADAIQKNWDQFAGVTASTPTPKTTVAPSEAKKPAAAAKKADKTTKPKKADKTSDAK